MVISKEEGEIKLIVSPQELNLLGRTCSLNASLQNVFSKKDKLIINSWLGTINGFAITENDCNEILDEDGKLL